MDLVSELAPTAREWASFTIFAGLALMAYAGRSGAFGIGAVLTMFVWRLSLLWLGYGAYVALIVLTAKAAGIWAPDLLHETIVWALGGGLPFAVSWIKRQPRGGPDPARSLLLRGVGQMIGMGALVGLYLELAAFEYLGEPLLQLWFTAWIIVQVIAAHEDRPAVLRWANRVLGVSLLVVVAEAALRMQRAQPPVDWGAEGRTMAVLLLLSAALVPLGYTLGLWSANGDVLRGVRVIRRIRTTDSLRVPLVVQLAYFAHIGWHFNDAVRFTHTWRLELAACDTWADVSILMGRYRGSENTYQGLRRG